MNLPGPASALPGAYLRSGSSSFAEFLAEQAPGLLPAIPRRIRWLSRRSGPARHHYRCADVTPAGW